MKRLLIIFIALLFALPCYALQKIDGLYGFGADTRGAYEATNQVICVVDDLTDDATGLSYDATYGPNNTPVFKGSFRACMEQITQSCLTSGCTIDSQAISADSGKIILFEVSGTIEESCESCDASEYRYMLTSETEIRGESAPSPGILLKNINIYGEEVHDVVITHLRMRMPDENTLADNVHRCIGFYAGNGGNVYNILIDHVSTSWGVDQNIDFYRLYGESNTLYDVTVSNSLLGEPIKSAYAKNLLWGY